MKYSLNNGKVITIPDDEIQNSMDKLKLSLHEAIQMWLEDNEFELNEEQEELDQKAKQVKIKLGATSANKERKKTKERTVKISDEKKRFFILTSSGICGMIYRLRYIVCDVCV